MGNPFSLKGENKMSTLINEIKRVCQEEGITFIQFVEKIKNPPKRALNGDLFGESDK